MIDSDLYPDHRALAALQSSEDAGHPIGFTRARTSASPVSNRYPGLRFEDRRNARVPDIRTAQERSRTPLGQGSHRALTASASGADVASHHAAQYRFGSSTSTPNLTSLSHPFPPSGPPLPSLRSVVDLPLSSTPTPFSPGQSYSLPGSFASVPDSTPVPSLCSGETFRGSTRRHSDNLPRPHLWRSFDDKALLDSFNTNLS